jgi:hypothetical protein
MRYRDIVYTIIQGIASLRTGRRLALIEIDKIGAVMPCTVFLSAAAKRGDVRRVIAIAMTLQELCTNTKNFGTLSVPTGSVAIDLDGCSLDAAFEQEPSAIADRCRSMGAQDLGAATMIETDTLLVKCPYCGGWPMAACFPKPNSPQREIRLRCAQCRHQEGGQLRRAGSGERLSGNPAHSPAHHEMR